MADLTITPANVSAGGGSSVDTGVAGDTITAGQVVYKDTTTNNRLKLADADALASSIAAGIALNPATSGQVLNYLKAGSLILGSGITPGAVYCVSATAGGIAPYEDLVSKYVTVIGIGTSTSGMTMRVVASRTQGGAGVGSMWTGANTVIGSQIPTINGSVLMASITVPGSMIAAGTVIRVTGSCVVTDSAGPGPTHQLKWKVGGTAGAADGTDIFWGGTFQATTQHDHPIDIFATCIVINGVNFLATGGMCAAMIGAGAGALGNKVMAAVVGVDQALSPSSWTAGTDLLCKLCWASSSTTATVTMSSCCVTAIKDHDGSVTLA